MAQSEPNRARYRRYYKKIADAAELPTARAYSGAIFSFLAVALFGLYAVLPTIRTILYLRREIADKTIINKQMEDKISALIEGQAAYEEAGANIGLVNEAIPITPNAAELALVLRNLSRATNASTSAINIATVPLVAPEATTGAQQRKSELTTYPVTLITNGGFTNLKSFLDGLLSLKRIVTIDSMRITPSHNFNSTTDEGGVALQLILQLKSYYHIQ